LFLSADRDGIFRAQPITIGANLGKSDRQFRLDLSPRQKETRAARPKGRAEPRRKPSQERRI
jgi:hypothetical protein